MNSNNLINNSKKELENNGIKKIIDNIKSEYILKKVFANLSKYNLLAIIKYNKKVQNIFNIELKDYQEYSEIFSPIIIEITPVENKYGIFINTQNASYIHIYVNNSKEEMKRNCLTENDNISKIKIVIDYQIQTFSNLFERCNCIKSINFKRFLRKNIYNMSYMFSECSSLEELNLSNFNTNNVTDMTSMFYECSSLKKLNLSKFNTENAKYMSYMFYQCSSLKDLNLFNFNTTKVTNMGSMFYECVSLEELNLANFNTTKVTNMGSMFFNCSSLKKLNISNIKINFDTKINNMFSGCSNELKMEIKKQNKNIKKQAFDD